MSQPGGILGIGVDIVETARIRSSIEEFGERFLKRVFTEAEIAHCSSQADPVPSYAARFAAKEAVAKAFGVGIGQKMQWTDIEVMRLKSGAPVCQLHGQARQTATEMKVERVLISLSHSEHYAVANALLC